MNFLEFSQQPIPRNDQGVRKYSRSTWTIFGFVMYGVVYGFLALMLVACAAVVVDLVILPDGAQKQNPWLGTALDVFFWMSFAVSWLPFVQWVRRRMGSETRLLREGVLVEGKISSPTRRYMRGSPYTTLTLEFEAEGNTHKASLSTGGHPEQLFEDKATCPVLYHRESEYCIGIIDPQQPIPAKLQR